MCEKEEDRIEVPDSNSKTLALTQIRDLNSFRFCFVQIQIQIQILKYIYTYMAIVLFKYVKGEKRELRSRIQIKIQVS